LGQEVVDTVFDVLIVVSVFLVGDGVIELIGRGVRVEGVCNKIISVVVCD
jgi:hypothetical protein